MQELVLWIYINDGYGIAFLQLLRLIHQERIKFLIIRGHLFQLLLARDTKSTILCIRDRRKFKKIKSLNIHNSGDYTQFMKLVVVVLTGDTDCFKFTWPGSLSKARWMAKAIYSLDLLVLKDKINRELGKNLFMTR